MKLIHLDKIGSTNEYAKENMGLLEDKTAIYADIQTSGHGRSGRKWIDTGKDNLYLTLVLKPFNDLNPIYSNLTQY
ncbi:MAG: hypothetical protein LUB59_01750, partial [Candidatus Gastranaerophilales bacterium]|nr:hypothetical protein [Candidatus Gastranaerophilales bacterium]